MESIAVPVSLTVELQPEGADIGSLERAVGAALAEAGRQLWSEVIAHARGAAARAARSRRLRWDPEGQRPGAASDRDPGGRGGALAAPLSLRGLRRGGRAARRAPRPRAPGPAHPGRPRAGPLPRHRALLRQGAPGRSTSCAPSGSATAGSTRWVAEEGARIEAEAAARTEALLGAHPERHASGRMAGDVWVSADGTMVNDRGSGTHMEVKLGLVFTGSERTGQASPALLDRHLVGATGTLDHVRRALHRGLRGDGRLRGGAHPLRLRRRGGHPLDPRAQLPRRGRAARLVPPRRAAALRGGSAARGRSSRRRSGRPARATSRPSSPSCAAMPARSRPTSPSRRSAAGPSSATSRPTARASPTTASCRWPARDRWRRASTSASAGASRPGA